jgi:hypothetical protein
MPYRDYLKTIKEPEELAFWTLYEQMDTYALTFFKKVLSILNFLEKPKSSSGTISSKTSKLSERLNITLQCMIDGLDEVMFDKIMGIFKDWIQNCSEDGALILVSSITARLASKNPEKMGTLIPFIISRLLTTEKDEQGNVEKTI